MHYEKKARELGYILDNPPTPAANYLPAIQTGSPVYSSGCGPTINNKVVYSGRLGENLTVEEGYQAARLSMINLLTVLNNYLGSLDRVSKIVKMTGYVASTSQFSEQPKIINGASDLLVEVFGEKGRHARCAIGSASLPRGMAIELDLIVEITD